MQWFFLECLGCKKQNVGKAFRMRCTGPFETVTEWFHNELCLVLDTLTPWAGHSLWFRSSRELSAPAARARTRPSRGPRSKENGILADFQIDRLRVSSTRRSTSFLSCNSVSFTVHFVFLSELVLGETHVSASAPAPVVSKLADAKR